MDDEIEKLSVAILKEGLKEEILDGIARVFGVDAVSIVAVKDLELDFIRTSNYFKNHNIDIETLYDETKERRLLFSKAIYEKVVMVEDYQHYPEALEDWKATGLKSVFLIKLSDKFNAVLGFENFESIKHFDEEFLKAVDFIKPFIEKAVEVELLEGYLKREYELLNIKPPKDSSSATLKQWINNALSKINLITHAKAVSFIFPAYGIYAVLSRDNSFVSFRKTKAIEKMLVYKMYKQKLKGPSVFRYEFSKAYFDCIEDIYRRYGVKNLLILPVWDNKELKAVAGFGYSADYHFSIYDVNFVDLLSRRLVEQIEATEEFDRLRSVITKSEQDIINSFVMTIELRDVYTKGHSQRVAYYALRIAQVFGYDEKFTERLYVAGLLHDIGKISIPDAVLLKPSKLTKVEYEMIKYHPLLSYELVRQFRSLKDLKQIAKIVKYHHEHCDGSGYPDALECRHIPKGARILAIADVFDALTTSRPYRKAFQKEDAIKIMLSEKGHFDESMLKRSVDVLINSFEDAMKISFQSLIPKAFGEYKTRFSTIDPMTGLLKRSALIRNIEHLLSINKPFRLYMVDVKNLDLVNIRMGSAVGDEVIIATTECLEELKKFNAISLCRLGGDSFVFVVCDRGMYDKIESRLKNLSRCVCERFNKQGLKLEISFSIVSLNSVEGISADELIYKLRKAKKALSTKLDET
ncbi:HD domain-containing phosphohydrolase [Hippea jasoniae]|uniref:HD domain-containing phosphohydrolase n=1 Tax=Hippea jasoniae TaxID=944479 RepID=UPI000690A013|nr:HD domain-containing phosphohydrolase [Hippea jasoniae]